MTVRGVRLCLGVLSTCCGLSALGAGGAPGAASPDTRRFVFNEGFSGSPGLSFSLSRPVPTFLPDGTPLAADAARYAPLSALASAPVFESVRSLPATQGNQILGSGLDHDGTTPLLVVLGTGGATDVVDVFAGEDIAHADATGIGRVRTELTSPGDLMRGRVAGRAYSPAAGAVCHGLIAVACTVLTRAATDQPWQSSATALVVSQDRGLNWMVAFESSAFAPGWTRGSPWIMQNWWPVKRDVLPTEAFFISTDYCLNPGAPGGRTLLVRATRPAPGRPWSVDPGAVIYSVNGTGEHLHAAGVLPTETGGLRALIAVGDQRRYNGIVSLKRPDHDYLGPIGWKLLGDYQGGAGDPGIEGNQFVGCAPGPLPRTLLVGSDLSSEQIMLLSADDGALHPATRRLYGLSRSDVRTNTVFSIRTPTPERGGPYCASFDPVFGPPPPSMEARALFSSDGLVWTQAAQPLSGFPCIHGGHMYFDGHGTLALRRMPLPATVRGRPLVVGPGGLQRRRNDASCVSPSAQVTPLQRDSASRWLDPDSAQPLLPQPPAGGPVYRVRTRATEPAPNLGELFPAGAGPFHDSILGQHLHARWWLMNPDDSRSASLSVGMGGAWGSPQVYRSSLIAATRSWYPVEIADRIETALGEPPMLSVRSAGPICDDQTVYLALDTLVEGYGFPGYPLPADHSAPAVGTPCPDELAAVRGLSCGPAWTITLALSIAEDGFDDGAALQRSWPLATIWSDDANYVQLVADTANDRLLARYTVRGAVIATLAASPTRFQRGSIILVSLAQPLGGPGEMTSSAGGQEPRTVVQGDWRTNRLTLRPRELRFYGPGPQTTLGLGARVSPILVWGGSVDERTALSEAERREMLTGLRFLDPLGP